MIREKVHTFGIGQAFLDIALTVAAFFIAYWLRRALLSEELKGFLNLGRIGWMILLIVPVWFVLLNFEQAYPSFEERSIRRVCYRAAKGALEGLGILFAVIFFRRAFAQSRLFILLFGIIDIIMLVGVRVVVFELRRLFYSRGNNLLKVLIVGTDARAKGVSQLIRDQSYWGFEVAGFLALPGQETPASENTRIVGKLEDLGGILHNSHIDWVIFAVSPDSIELVKSGIAECEEIGVQASYLMSDMFPVRIARMHLDTYDGTTFLTFTTTKTYRWALLAKGTADRIAAAVGLLVLSPLLALIAILIKFTSRGPVFFRQVRCGLNGRRFTMYKFRTMKEGAEEMLDEIRGQYENGSGVVFKSRNDPRVTRLGRFLRRLSFDELPQLLNVLTGEMSLVGPRPRVASEVEKYERWQRRRLSMKPGLTGIWQVGGRNEVDFEDGMRLDLEYIDTWSLSLDARILLKTIPAVLWGRGAY
jgi:exopolysaccharide biosynthesis polyprenyl glycosylphosphotransferase